MSVTGYLAPVDLEHELRDEMAAAGRRVSQHPHGRLVVSADEPLPSVWAANVWRNVEQIPITSIGHAAKELRGRQRNWALYAPLHGGRARLIAEKLPSVSAKPVPIGGAAPDAPLGSWTLVEPDLMLAAGDCSSPFPNGEAQLVETREGPPVAPTSSCTSPSRGCVAGRGRARPASTSAPALAVGRGCWHRPEHRSGGMALLR